MTAARPAAARLPVVEVHGAGFDAGRRYGEGCRTLVERHLELSLQRLEREQGLTRDEVLGRVTPYRACTSAALPGLAAEVDGVEAGAGLPEGGGWALQLRAELSVGVNECSSFAALAPAAADGPLAGQNADLPPDYGEVLVLVRRVEPGRPVVLTVTPAGQLAHHGMNGAGVGVFANFLHAHPWRHGVPRYMATRVALAQKSRAEAVAAVESVPWAAPRNLLVADRTGATDVEMTPTAQRQLAATDGLLAHTNHFLSPLRRGETAEPGLLHNSRRRLTRLEQLLAQHHGRLDVDRMQRILRDRDGAPHALCHLASDCDLDVATVVSSIAELDAGRLWVAAGPPSECAYVPYDVG